MKNLILLFAMVVVISSCKTESSDDVDVSAVHQSYYYKYDANTNKTHAYAEFRDGGPLGNDIILYAPSGITLNGETMDYNSFPFKLYYHYSSAAHDGEVTEGTFVFTDKNSKTYTNVANLNQVPVIGFPTSISSISKSIDLVIEWTGTAVADGETVTINLFGADTLFENSTAQIGATSLMFSKENLAAFPNGSISAYIERSTIYNLQNTTSKGGIMQLGYYFEQTCVIED